MALLQGYKWIAWRLSISSENLAQLTIHCWQLNHRNPRHENWTCYQFYFSYFSCHLLIETSFTPTHLAMWQLLLLALALRKLFSKSYQHLICCKILVIHIILSAPIGCSSDGNLLLILLWWLSLVFLPNAVCCGTSFENVVSLVRECCMCFFFE